MVLKENVMSKKKKKSNLVDLSTITLNGKDDKEWLRDEQEISSFRGIKSETERV